MWVFIGTIVVLTVIYFLRYELPGIMFRWELEREMKENPRRLELTGHISHGLTRDGKEIRWLVR